MGKLKLAVVLLAVFAIPACASKKVIVKNCDQTNSGEHFVCETI